MGKRKHLSKGLVANPSLPVYRNLLSFVLTEDELEMNTKFLETGEGIFCYATEIGIANIMKEEE